MQIKASQANNNPPHNTMDQHGASQPKVYDKTNYAQSLMHMIKGNLGTGILAMPSTFALCGLLYGAIGLPILCLIAVCCVHLLVRSSQHLETKINIDNLEYAELAKGSFKTGPQWLRSKASLMCLFVDAILIISQMGICCVYIVFIVDNAREVLISQSVINKLQVEVVYYLYIITLLLILPLSYIRTLRTLSFVSGIANALQVIGICITVYLLVLPDEQASKLLQTNSSNSTTTTQLLQQENHNNLTTITNQTTTTATSNHNSFEESQFAKLARGFGGAMFAFEGISVVIPIYNRMKRPHQMGGTMGIVNVSYSILLFLYMLVGITGYLKFGQSAKASISESLSGHQPFSDIVRCLFIVSLLFSYPLQFYVPNEIVWNWFRSKFLAPKINKKNKITTKQVVINNNNNNKKELVTNQTNNDLKYEIACRTVLVLITFILAITIKKLRLLMELVGAVSGTALSIILPPMIHLATFWEDTSGLSKAFMLVVDLLFITLGIIASASGGFFSLREIINHY